MLTSWVASFTLQAILFVPLYLFVNSYTRITILGHIFRGISAAVIYLNPFWKLTRTTPLPPRPKKAIIMCNHQSNSDPFFLCSALFPWETKYISKASLFQVPFGGWSMTLAGDVPVYFTREKEGWGTVKGSVGKMMDRLKELLNHDIPIAVFPEGTRSRTGELGEFKDGMFALAKETSAAIIPCAIDGSKNAWPVGDWRFQSAKVYVAVGSEITVQPDETPQQLRDRVKAEIARLQETLPSQKTKKK